MQSVKCYGAVHTPQVRIRRFRYTQECEGNGGRQGLRVLRLKEMSLVLVFFWGLHVFFFFFLAEEMVM